MKGISVIIPCYNTEKYIDKCINSVLNQTFKKIEIVLVDDCSSDNTWKIINDYSNKHNNIKVYKNKENKGAGYSRNFALKHATNDLISFIDSDDYIEPNYYEIMLNTMKEDKANLVVCDICIKYDLDKETSVINKACTNPSDKYSYINNGLAASPCNKIFRKEDLLKYPFPEGIMNEDISTVIPIIVSAKKISYTDSVYYNYVQRKTSVQNSKISSKRFDLFKALNILEERLERNTINQKYWDAIVYNQVISFLFFYLTQEKNSMLRKKYLKEYNKLSKKYDIKDNPLLMAYYNQLGKKHRYYYKVLINCNTKGLYNISNSIISFYHWYLNSRKSVIKKDITIYDLEKLAKKQSLLPASEYKLSVVIPNYNYEKFLLQRIYSILYQKEKIYEIIILDDCSKDNSRELIEEIENSIKKYIKVIKIYNTENSGIAFKQWKKGFEAATGDYVWIAEADDYCSSNFLTKVMKPIKNSNDIVLSYSDTAFINKDGYITLKTVKNQIDSLGTGHWNKSFIRKGNEEIKEYAYLNCTISNVSSVIFKKGNYSDSFAEAEKFKQAGDWIFYIDIMSNGKIAYCNKPLNYYRIHGNNVTTTTKKQQHFEEIKMIHKKIEDTYGFSNEQKNKISERYKYLKEVWNLEDSNKKLV